MTRLADLVTAGLVAEHVSLAPLTTYRFGGPARWFAEPHSGSDLSRIGAAVAAERAAGEGVEILVLGRGSNLAVADAGYPGLVVRLGVELGVGDVAADGVVAAGAAAPLPMVARAGVREGRGGLEFFVGIPGSVGGAVRMNAGCYGSDTAGCLVEAHLVSLDTGAAAWRTPADLEMRYRHSAVRPDEVVTVARFATEARPRAEGEALLREITRWRRDTQPGGTLNAGSVFKNPPGDAAGRRLGRRRRRVAARPGATGTRRSRCPCRR